MPITRFPSIVSAAIANGAAVSNPIPMADYSGGSVMLPAAWTSANIGFKVCDTTGGTFIPLRDQSGSLVQITNVQAAEADAYPLPDELFGAMYFELWSCTSAGADTNQGAARSLTVCLKG